MLRANRCRAIWQDGVIEDTDVVFMSRLRADFFIFSVP